MYNKHSWLWTRDLSRKLHTPSFAKADFSRWCVLHLLQHFSFSQGLTLCKGLVRPCVEYACRVWDSSTYIGLLDRVGSKAFRFISFHLFTDCLLSLKFLYSFASLLCSSDIFLLTTHVTLLTACLRYWCGLAALTFLLSLMWCPNTLWKS